VILFGTSYPVTWAPAHICDQRPIEPVYVVAGAVLSVSICRLPVLQGIACAIIATYSWLTTYEFWGGRRAAGLALACVVHGVRAGRAVSAAHTSHLAPEELHSVWLTVLSLGPAVHEAAIAPIRNR
jgi:hypothetical protein